MSNTTDTYNYPRFRSREYDLNNFPGPKLGELAPDFDAVDMDGNPVKLSDYRGKMVVLETGSITCPQYVRRISPMKKLAAQYPDITFLIIYVREAHPGDRIPEHSSMKEKINLAHELRQAEDEQRIMLIDDLQGSVHNIYGSLPNVFYILDADGKVLYRADWNNHKYTKLALANIQAGQKPDTPSNGFRPVAPPVLLRVLNRAGLDAVFDFFAALPFLIWQHIYGALTDLRNG
ncbi:MAG: redoxin domain-containing protein [Deltaproteobacteria bacterium]